MLDLVIRSDRVVTPAGLGVEPAPMSPEEFGRYVRAEIAKWAKVVKESGAKAD